MQKATAMEVIGSERKVAGVSVSQPAEEEASAKGANHNILTITTFEAVLRVATVILNVSALLVMVKNRHKAANPLDSLAYSDSTGFKFLVYSNGVSAGYTILAALCIRRPQYCTAKGRSWIIFLLDQVFTYSTVAAGTICVQILYMAYHGVSKLTWSEACSTIDNFCRKTTHSTAITFVAAVCYILLSLISSYRLFSDLI